MSTPIQLLVGLANPGKQYANTRHNAGAWWIDLLAERANITLKPETKFHGLYGSGNFNGTKCHLLIPTTFMNLSGQSVRACMSYLKINPAEILIAHDEIDIPAGDIKLKFDGGDGGHNGLKDIIRHLNTKQFHRLRIGVGRPSHQQETVVDYVLNPPSKVDKHKIDQALIKAEDIVPLLFEGQIAKAMQQLHTSIE